MPRRDYDHDASRTRPRVNLTLDRTLREEAEALKERRHLLSLSQLFEHLIREELAREQRRAARSP
jgi:hypothetical protein